MFFSKLHYLKLCNTRSYAALPKSQSCVRRSANGLLLGIYSKDDGRLDSAKLTKSAAKYNDVTKGRLWELLRSAGPCPALGETRIFYELDPEFSSVGIVGLGDPSAGLEVPEGIDRKNENIRVAAGAGVRALEPLQLKKLYIEGFGNAEAAAEGAGLGVWKFQELRSPKSQKTPPVFELFDDSDWTGWSYGLEKAAAQNLARRLTATPANILTPLAFALTSVEVLCRTGVNVDVKDRNWAELQGMGGLLAVAKGSAERPIFLELSYYGTGNMQEPPIVLIGKGSTFESGGLNLLDVEQMGGDKSGAACVVAATLAAAKLQLQINIRGLIPLTENMPGCQAMKPGDTVRIYNGKNILIQDTRCAGRLMVADALAFAATYQPQCIVDVGSFTRGALNGLSTAASGVFTSSENLWKMLSMSSIRTGDRVWRLPLFQHYSKKTSKSRGFDMKTMPKRNMMAKCCKTNLSDSCSGEPCHVAAFLREFAPSQEWMHIDNYGVMASDGETDAAYLQAGMTGRPTRTLIELLYQLHSANNAG